MHRVAIAACLILGLGELQTVQGSGKIPITTRSEPARALFLRARALNEALQPHEAHALFQQAVAHDSSFAMAEYYLASTAPTANEASGHLQRALALAPRVSAGERLMILGLEARTHADRARARQIAESLVVQYPEDERAHFVLGTVYSAQHLYDRTIAQYQRAITIDPGYSLAYNQLGYAFRSAGNLAAAETSFRKYIALVPNDPNPYDSYAELLMKMGRFDESIAQYRKALAIDPHFGGSHVGIAADHMFSGRYAAAIAELDAYDRAARNDNERRTMLLNEAMVYVDKGATDSAVAALRRSMGIARAGADTINMSADEIAIGDVLLEAGRVDAARERYVHAHDLVAASHLAPGVRQDDALARHYDLARVALAHHDLATARSEAAAYVSGAMAGGNDARVRQAHELNGLTLLEAKQIDASLGELALADQENPAVMYAMARAHAGHGATEKAREMSAQAARMNILPTLPYVFTRAAIAAATRSATSDSAGGRPR
ncbi:MAG TPA: tetratricopeptide repeat protein [Gemmatimonadaceae bacterium]|jgi:tetratricopeptide (TPR) repeat protein|nr:tetratricopeptide repeat protein [Gemmatimonadaceae bacterium]